MRKIILCITAVTGLLLFACSGKQAQPEEIETDSLSVTIMKGDSAIYGLACDGCTDSVIVLLPHDGSDPVTYDILNAKREHKVIGRPKIGDNLAVLLNPENPKEALSVIDIDEMKGTWVYLVTPTLRKRVDTQAQHQDEAVDSALKKMMVPREYGFRLKRDKQVTSIGMAYRATTTDDQSPIVYPQVRRYSEWHIFNGKLILVHPNYRVSSNGKAEQQSVELDTAEIVFMMKDSLQLRFKDGVKNYYRKNEENTK